MKKFYLPIAIILIIAVLVCTYFFYFYRQVTIRGTLQCLPEEEGIINKRCFHGLTDTNGNLYNLEPEPTQGEFPRQVEVKGALREPDENEMYQYKSIGVIKIRSIKEYNNGN